MAIKKQHYIPKFLLKNFCNESGKLSAFNLRNGRLLVNQSFSNVAHVNKMYNLNQSDLREVLHDYLVLYPEKEHKIDFKDDEFIEKYHARIESSMGSLIKRILTHDHLVLAYEDKLLIVTFLYDLGIRTKSLRDIRHETSKEVDKIIKKSIELGKIKSEEDAVKLYDSNKTELGLLFDVKNHVEFSNRIMSDFEICYAVNNTKVGFILSDDPCRTLHIGIASDFCFPISTNRALVFRRKDLKRENMVSKIPVHTYVMNLSYFDVISYNSMILISAHECVYGSEESIRETIFGKLAILMKANK